MRRRPAGGDRHDCSPLCPAARGPLEAYAAHFDPLFRRLAQRRAFRTYLVWGLIALGITGVYGVVLSAMELRRARRRGPPACGADGVGA